MVLLYVKEKFTRFGLNSHRMPELVKISDRTYNFHHRGRQTIDFIDLFDECRYGANKLYFRGRFESGNEVANQIEKALDPAYKDYGGGNPVAIDKMVDGKMVYAEGIALNRFNYPETKFWHFPDAKDPYPRKAKYAVQFMMRLHFHMDWAYVIVGLPWAKLHLPDGSLNPKYPVDQNLQVNGVTINDLELLEHWAISRADCKVFLSGLVADDGGRIKPVDPHISPEAEAFIEDDTVLVGEESSMNASRFVSVNDEVVPEKLFISQERPEN